jgi:hypothetical protein
LEAQKVMVAQKIDVVPVVDRSDPSKVVCVLTSEGMSAAIEKAKSLR